MKSHIFGDTNLLTITPKSSYLLSVLDYEGSRVIDKELFELLFEFIFDPGKFNNNEKAKIVRPLLRHIEYLIHPCTKDFDKVELLQVYTILFSDNRNIGLDIITIMRRIDILIKEVNLEKYYGFFDNYEQDFYDANNNITNYVQALTDCNKIITMIDTIKDEFGNTEKWNVRFEVLKEKLYSIAIRIRRLLLSFRLLQNYFDIQRANMIKIDYENYQF